MGYTAEQIKAVDYAENHSASVSASAGSGKTLVLVEHIAKLISDKENVVPADKIAAVTFTEKAAAELRQRLEKRVHELIKANPDDEFFRDQLIRLSSARISTISSFCLSIIRENLRYLPDITEDFTVCDDVKSKQLSAEAVEYVKENIYSGNMQRQIFSLLGGESDLTDKLEQLDNFLSNIPDPEGWINNQLNIFTDEKLYFLNYEKKGAELFIRYLNEAGAQEAALAARIKRIEAEEKAAAAAKEKAKSAKNEGAKAEADAELKALTKEKSGLEAILNSLAELKKFKEKVSESLAAGKVTDREDNLKLALALPEKITLADPLNKEYELKRLTERINSCNKLAIELFEDKENRKKCRDAFRFLTDIWQDYEKRLTLIKKREKVFDFSDLEKYALKILTENSRESSGETYGKSNFLYIIVDEFQDSNDIQYEIFKLLSDNEKNLYFVGDVKQSIYKFRNANPDIFAGCLANPAYERLTLNSNFRSSDDVINTVNLCFGKNMPYEFANGDWQDMRAARGIQSVPQNKSEIVIINSAAGQEDREPLYIANRIEKMVKSGFIVHNKDNSPRPCGYGDFAVLMRNNKSCAEYRRVFEERGIPCVSIGDKAFTDLTEINITLSVLETVMYPNNDLSSATAMMSPAYGFTAEDMARLKLLAGKQEEWTTLYGSLSLAASQLKGENNFLAEKAEKFLKDIRLLRKKASDCVTEELIRHIYNVTEIDKLMSVGVKGRERRENLRLLLHYAKSYPRPGDFLAMIKNISRNKLEMSQAVVKEQEEKSVKVMTIHSSKGLQYPIVFLSHTNGTASKSDSDKIFDYDRKNGIGITICDYNKKQFINTLSRRILADTERDKARGEELRLLYVALTRAEEKLIITAKAGLTASRKTGTVNEYSHPVYQMGNTFSFFYNISEKEPSAFSLTRIQSTIDLSAPAANNQSASARTLPNFDEAARRLGYEYPYKSAVKTPAKFTATALGVNAEAAGQEDNVSTAFYMGLPLFMKEGRPLTSKEIGDIYHKVMEKLDFSSNSAEAELDRLEKEGEISSEEKAAVEPNQLQAFLDSRLCKRAAGSGKIYREFPLFTTINATGEEGADNEDLSFIQGIADMFFVEKGEIVLIDYKTNRNTTAEKLIAEYRGQLKIYKKALEEMLGMNVKEAMLFSFSLKKEIPVSLS